MSQFSSLSFSFTVFYQYVMPWMLYSVDQFLCYPSWGFPFFFGNFTLPLCLVQLVFPSCPSLYPVYPVPCRGSKPCSCPHPCFFSSHRFHILSFLALKERFFLLVLSYCKFLFLKTVYFFCSFYILVFFFCESSLKALFICTLLKESCV